MFNFILLWKGMEGRRSTRLCSSAPRVELSVWGRTGVDSRRAGRGRGRENSAVEEGVARALVFYGIVCKGRKEEGDEGEKKNSYL